MKNQNSTNSTDADEKIKLSVMVEGSGMPVNTDEEPILLTLEERLDMDMDFQVVRKKVVLEVNKRADILVARAGSKVILLEKHGFLGGNITDCYVEDRLSIQKAAIMQGSLYVIQMAE